MRRRVGAWVLGVALTGCAPAAVDATGGTGSPPLGVAASPEAQPSSGAQASPTAQASPASTASPSGAAAVSFRVDVAPVLEAKCAACHGQGGRTRPHFLDAQGKTSHALFAPSASEAWREVSRGKMPPAGSPALSADEVAKLQAWVNAGQPDN